jgi:CHAT domain-containing protein
LLPAELRCQSEPGLALTPGSGEPESPKDDALLVTSEISGWHLDADLFVLSACNAAGDGKRLGGQSLSGLVESFFFAGSRSVLASHWQAGWLR